MQDGMLRSASIRSAKTPSDSLGCLQDDPKTPQRRPPGRPRRTQSASKTAPRRLQDALRRPKTLQGAPKRPPRRSSDAPRGLQDAILIDFRKQNGSMLALKINEKKSQLRKAILLDLYVFP